MEIKELTVLRRNKNVVVHVFEENGELKAIVDDDFELILKVKDPSEDEPNT